MKLTTLLSILAGLRLVTASHVQTDLIAHPPWALLKPRALVSWKDAEELQDEPERKIEWEQTCSLALDERACDIGVIHGVEYPSTNASGEKVPYVKVLGKLGPGYENWKTSKPRKFRVYQDGSSRYGWTRLPKKEAKHLEKGKKPREQPLLFWNNVHAYEEDQKQKEEWEKKCGNALVRASCHVGMIHEPKKMTKEGYEMPYIDVVGAPITDMEKTKKVRVFENGTFQRGWRTHHRKPESDAAKSPGDHNVLLSWGPVDIGRPYGDNSKRKIDWEENCHRALRRKGCGFGIIHRAETRVTKNMRKTSYVNVEGAPSKGMKTTERMRVFWDGSSEDGWTMRDKYLMQHPAQKRRKIMGLDDQEEAENPKHRIIWDPPNAYKGQPSMRESFEDACRIALAREGCDFGIIHKGHHSSIDSADGTRTGPLYIKVSAGTNENPENKRLMKLYENGLSEWYQEGPLAKKEMKRYWKGGPLIPAAYTRPRGRPRKYKKSTGASTQAPPQSPQMPHHTPAQVPTEVPSPGQADPSTWS